MKRGMRIANVIIWGILSLIWIGLTVTKIISGDELWLILMNAFVAALTLVDFVIHLVFLIKRK